MKLNQLFGKQLFSWGNWFELRTEILKKSVEEVRKLATTFYDVFLLLIAIFTISFILRDRFSP